MQAGSARGAAMTTATGREVERLRLTGLVHLLPDRLHRSLAFWVRDELDENGVCTQGVANSRRKLGGEGRGRG